VTRATLDHAQRLANENADSLGLVLTRLGILTETELAAALAAALALPIANLADFPSEPILEELFNPRFLKQARCIPIAERDAGVAIAFVDPTNSYALGAARFAARRAVLPYIASHANFEAAFARLYTNEVFEPRPSAEARGGGSEDLENEDVDRLKDLASDAPVIRLVNQLVARAVESRASDIHIEPLERDLRIRYRIDGVLQEIEPPPAHLRATIVSRVKILAKLNIAERRLAQDGRIRMAIRGQEIDLRVATTPTINGESVVLRILDRGNIELDYTALGLEADLIVRLHGILAQPHGIVLVTGPTGSGKTTTLYTALHELNTSGRKILTIEDPVEYQIKGVNQVQVKPQIGLTFANALRSFLRQDPDIIMVGEIRDLETARVAVQAALTGHLILSTVHTNDAASTITRLLDMGIEDYLIASTVNGLVAQRLVRTLCKECRLPYELSNELADRLKIDRMAEGFSGTLYRAVGCEACRKTGYLGRTCLIEVLPVSPSVRGLIMDRAAATKIEETAIAEGMRTIYLHGLAKALRGVTSLEEVLQVVGAG
jgi:general secretion pathway protein E